MSENVGKLVIELELLTKELRTNLQSLASDAGKTAKAIKDVGEKTQQAFEDNATKAAKDHLKVLNGIITGAKSYQAQMSKSLVSATRGYESLRKAAEAVARVESERAKNERARMQNAMIAEAHQSKINLENVKQHNKMQSEKAKSDKTQLAARLALENKAVIERMKLETNAQKEALRQAVYKERLALKEKIKAAADRVKAEKKALQAAAREEDKRLKQSQKRWASFGNFVKRTLGKIFNPKSYFLPIIALNQGLQLLEGTFGRLYHLLKDLAGQFIHAAGKAEGLEMRMSNIFGSSVLGKETFLELEKFAMSVPFELEKVLESATNLAPILRDGRKELMEWMTVIADLSATTGLPLEQATSNFIKMYSAGAAAADLFRERGILPMLGFTPKVSYTPEETIKKVREQAQSGAAVFSGMAEKLAVTWDGQISRLHDKWFNFRRMVMADSGLFSTAKGILSTLNALYDTNSDRVREFAIQMGEWLNKKLIESVELVERLFNHFSQPDNFNQLKSVGSGILEVFKLFAKILVQIVLGLYKVTVALVNMFEYMESKQETANNWGKAFDWLWKGTTGRIGEMFSPKEAPKAQSDHADQLLELVGKLELAIDAQEAAFAVEHDLWYTRDQDMKRLGTKNTVGDWIFYRTKGWMNTIREFEDYNKMIGVIDRHILELFRMSEEQQKYFDAIQGEFNDSRQELEEIGKTEAQIVELEHKRMLKTAEEMANGNQHMLDMFLSIVDETTKTKRAIVSRTEQAARDEETKKFLEDSAKELAELQGQIKDFGLDESQQERNKLIREANEALKGKNDEERIAIELLLKHKLALVELEAGQEGANKALESFKSTMEKLNEELVAWKDKNILEGKTDYQEAIHELNQTALELYQTLTGQELKDSLVVIQNIREQIDRFYNRAPGTMFEGMTKGFDQWQADVMDLESFGEGLMTDVGEGLSTAFSTSFFDAIEGKYDSFKEGFASFMKDIAKIFIDQAIKMLVVQSMLKMFDMFGSSKPKPTALNGWEGLSPYHHHQGGMAGYGKPGPELPAWMFRFAPRFHDGLMPDEFPAVLQQGEGVFTKDQMHALGGALQTKSVPSMTININDSDEAGVMKALPALRQTILDVFATDYAQNGITRKTVRTYS